MLAAVTAMMTERVSRRARHRSVAFFALAAGLGLWLRTSVAAAADGDPAAKAKAEATAADGAKLLDQKRYADALGRFQAAYAVFPTPKLNYNFALAYLGMGKHALAYGAFERFVRETHDASPEYVKAARQELKRLAAAKVGFVNVVCDTDGAEVLLDGAPAGSSPLPARLPVDVGTHELIVRARDLGTRTRRFTAAAGKVTELKIELRPAVAGVPPGSGAPIREPERPTAALSGSMKAEALIREATSLRRAGMDARAYPLLVQAYEAQVSPRTAIQLGLVEMALGYWLDAEKHLTEGLSSPRDPWVWTNRASLEASLARTKAAIGEIVLTGTPAGAVVLVNGKQAGRLPLSAPLRAGEGPANVELQAPGYRPLVRSLNVVGGRREELTVSMERATGGGPPPQPHVPTIHAGESADAPTPAPGAGTWKWTGLALGAAGAISVGAGVAYLLRGDAGCDGIPASGACNKQGRSAAPGWALVGGGVAAGLAGGLVFFRHREHEVSVAVGPRPMLLVRGTL
jgi:tetratricopeptide (TPR) repeat protein